MSNAFAEFETKMRAARVSDAAIRAFKHSYDSLAAGKTGMLPERELQPVTSLPSFGDIPQGAARDGTLLAQAVVIKLNGGLGTGMGLEKAKSLLQLKDGLTFLDFIARQILHLREQHNSQLQFLLMNSFSTSRDTLDFLIKYPALGKPAQLELMQSAAPKVDAQTLRPAVWPKNPELEWCPPGHGDLYPSLLGSGWLDRLLAAGVKYLFVSNSDNLGASLDLDLLAYFAASDKPFLMEVCERTASDRKGGHLAQNQGRLLLRESAQCPEEDLPAFQDIQRHRFFNTNNLWVRLDHLKKLLDAQGGFIPLPIIKNAKTVDPRDKTSPKVFQLETAMGAAIECFENAGAIIVPRTRFAPVKTTADLLALRSDAYEVTEDWRLVLSAICEGIPPTIDLDAEHYKQVDQLDAALAGGVPSLARCRELKIRGPVRLGAKNIFSGKVTIINSSATPKSLPPGEYNDAETNLT
jgi:UDP-N-acetylglucosamine pyrophosphorylase